MPLDLEFIKRATRITSFNLSETDFTSLTYKDEIKHIFSTYLIPELANLPYAGSISTSINSSISTLKQSSNFMNLYNYKKIEGVGPGEVMLFLLVKGVRLGGAGSAGVDVIDGSTGYEVKAASITGDRKYAYDFTTGGTVKEVPLIITQMQKLAKSINITTSGNEISPNTLKAIKAKSPERYKEIEKQYSKAVGNYFAGHKTIFMNNKGGGAQAIGTVAAIKNVNPSDISMYHITRGNIKPIIKL